MACCRPTKLPTMDRPKAPTKIWEKMTKAKPPPILNHNFLFFNMLCLLMPPAVQNGKKMHTLRI